MSGHRVAGLCAKPRLVGFYHVPDPADAVLKRAQFTKAFPLRPNLERLFQDLHCLLDAAHFLVIGGERIKRVCVGGRALDCAAVCFCRRF